MAGIVTKLSRIVGTTVLMTKGKRENIRLKPVVINFIDDDVWTMAKKQSALMCNLLSKGLIQEGAAYTKEQERREQMIQDELDKDTHRLDKPEDGAADITADSTQDGIVFDQQESVDDSAIRNKVAPAASSDITEADDDLLS